MEGRGHRPLEHTADLALEVWAPTEAELLGEAALGIVRLMVEDATIAPGARRTFSLDDAADGEDRLVRWLNEVIYWAVTEGVVLAGAEVRLAEGRLEAEVTGEPEASGKLVTELKSVTYHQLELASGPEGWRARVIIDV